ncbi:MAG: hypothetical protein ACFB21_15270 [Opitutales bacterium]
MILDTEQGSEGDGWACRLRLVVANAALRQKHPKRPRGVQPTDLFGKMV